MKRKFNKLFFAFIALFSFSFCMTGCNNPGEQSGTQEQTNTEFTVSFNGNGGTLISGIEVQTVKQASEIIEPVYEKTGYEFDGWDKNIASIKSDTTINAKWKEKADSGTGISISGFTKNESTFNCKVNNNIESYSFIDKVNVSKGSTWKLFSDISGTQEIVTKTINLDIGDNTNYILVTSSSGDLGFYTVIVRRLNMFTVAFNTLDGTQIDNQTVQEESLVAPVNDPTRTGYDFISWDYDFSVPVTGDLIITAQWGAHHHKIILDVNGGNQLGTTELDGEYGSYITLPNPTRTGYKFDGWYKDDRKVTSGSWKYDEDVTLTAKWTGNTYSIKYVLNGARMQTGTNTYTSYEYTDKAQFGENYSVKTATKTGYTFGGWFNDDVEIKSGIWNIPNDVTVVGRWTANQYKITYDVNGGDPLDNNIQYVSYDESYSLVTPTRAGYSFTGWYLENNLFESGKWTRTSDVTIVAHWSANSYTVNLHLPSDAIHHVTFDYNDGRGIYKETDLKFGDTLSYEYPDSPDSFTLFTGWYLDKNCTLSYTYGSAVEQSYRLFAGWKTIEPEEDEYQILKAGEKLSTKAYFFSNYIYFVSPVDGKLKLSGSGFDSNNVGTYKLYKNGVEYKVNYSTQTFAFDSWNGKSFTINANAGDVFKMNLYSATSVSTLMKTTVKFWIEYGNENKAILNYPSNISSSPIVVTTDELYDLKYPSITGYVWKGWWTEPNGNGSFISDGLNNNKLTYENVSDLYGFLEPIKNSVSFDSNGGSTITDTLNLSYCSLYELPIPTREGYSFAGWYKDDVFYSNNGYWIETSSGQITLKAKWVPNQTKATLDVHSSALHYYIYLNMNDENGTIYKTLEVKKGETLQYPSNPSKSGYLFKGWYKDKKCTNRFEFNEAITDSITLYAGWEKSSGNTININGNSITKTVYNASITSYYFVAQVTGEYTLTYSANDQFYVSVGSVSGGYSGSGTIKFSVEAGKTYSIYYSLWYGTVGDNVTITFSLSGNVPSSSVTLSSSANKSLDISYGSQYNLGIPEIPSGMTFVGWFTQPNGKGQKLTDSNGASLEVWSFTTNISVYAYFI